MTRASRIILISLYVWLAALLYTTTFDLHRPVSVGLALLVGFLHWSEGR